jgi:energy-converting hydrogenase Eha subunit E
MPEAVSIGKKRKLTWWKKLTFSAIVVGLIFLALEILLALLGVTPIRETRDPVLVQRDVEFWVCRSK